MDKGLSKPLSDLLTAFNEEKKRTPPYVMFLAAKEEIEKALIEGWKVWRIWEVMTNDGRIRCSYATFAKYVRDTIQKQKQPENAPARKSEETKQKDTPPGATLMPSGRILPGWPKPGENRSSLPKLDPATYRGELPGFGKKTNPEDFHKF